MHLFLPKLEELATTVKTRRKLSAYACPHCTARLTYREESATDLFCPRCHTAVTLLGEGACRYMVQGVGLSCPCTLDDLTPRRRG